jgi:hypothetical protein
MRSWLLAAFTLAVLLGGGACSNKNVNPGLNAVPRIESAVYDAVARVLTVAVADWDRNAVTVAVTAPDGLAPDSTSSIVSGGNGSAAFTWTATAPEDGGSGDTTITATDGMTDSPPARVVHVSVAPIAGLRITGAGGVDLGHGSARLTVSVADTGGHDVTVGETVPAGMTADSASRIVTGGKGDAVFMFSADNPAAGAAGAVGITAADGHSATVAAAQAIAIAPYNPLSISAVTVDEQGGGMVRMTVSLANESNLATTVTASEPPGTILEHPEAVVPTGNGDAVFNYRYASANDVAATVHVAITAVDTQNNTASATQSFILWPYGPNIQLIPPTWHDNHDGTGALVVGAVYAPGAIVFSVTDVDGATVDHPSKAVGGSGETVQFIYTETSPWAGAGGDVTITAQDGLFFTAKVVQTISIASRQPEDEVDALYAVPLQTSAAVNAPVTIVVATVAPAHPLSFLSMVGVTVERGAQYVAGSFNLGEPGGARLDTDGYWALLGPPAPLNSAYLDLGDALLPGPAVDIGGGLQRFTFAVIPQETFAPPAVPPDGAAMLFNFQLTFPAPGTYHLGFQPTDGAFDQTYYSDGSNSYYWSVLDGSNTVTVN